MVVEGSKKKLSGQVFWEQRFNIAGSLFAVITAIASLTGTGDSWPVAMLSIAFFLIGNLDRFDTLKAGPGGFEAKIKEELKETRDRIEELKELAVLFGSTTIANIAYLGRWDGFSDEQEEQMISDIVRYFDKIGISNEKKEESLRPRYQTTEFDYSLLCTGGNKVPGDLPEGMSKDWEALREGGIAKIAKPDEIEEFFKASGILTDQRKELLEDYRYYLEHREHKRPEIWAQRDEIFK